MPPSGPKVRPGEDESRGCASPDRQRPRTSRRGEVRVLIAKNLPMLYPEQAAGVAQFAGSHLGQFGVGLGAAAIARRGSGGQTDNADLDSALGIQSKRPAEAAGFVIGMGGNAKKS